MSLNYSRLPPAPRRMAGFNAGKLLSAFDPDTGEYDPSDVIGVTAGEVRFEAKPRFTDLGAGMVNCPPNAREMLCPGGWEARLTGALATVDARATRRLVALSRAEGRRVAPGAAMPEFGEVWLVFDYGDMAANPPGFYAIHLPHALCAGGFGIAVGDGVPARWPFEFVAFGDLDGAAPFELYVSDGG